MSSIDVLFNKRYDEDLYNCAHLVCDAWLIKTGEDITRHLIGLLKPIRQRFVDGSQRHYFEAIKKPQTPCIIQMRNKGYSPHVGMYMDGYVLQITEQGVQYQPLEISTRGFKKVKYYRKRQ